jgi:hypothetical protein
VIGVAFFTAINGLSELEDREKWEEARFMLYELWNADRENLDLLLRLLSECWYVLCEWGCSIMISDEDPAENPIFRIFKDTLIECTTYGLTHFSNDPRFLWMAGYMISMFPYLFYDGDTGDLYTEWESKGKEMLALLYKQNPNDLMAKIAHLGSYLISDADKEYRKAKRKLTPLLGNYFTDSTVIEQYFKNVLSDPITGGRNATIPLTSYEGKSTQGKYYGTGGNVIILSNMDTNNREEWTPFVQNLPLDYCTVLTYDYLQHEDDQARVLEDVIHFTKRGGGEKIVLIGAGSGGIASLRVATCPVLDEAVIGVVSISAPFERGGAIFFTKEELRRIKIPKLLINTESNEYAAGTRQMYEFMVEPKELCLYSGGVHGTEIFDAIHRDTLIRKLNAFVNSSFGPGMMNATIPLTTFYEDKSTILEDKNDWHKLVPDPQNPDNWYKVEGMISLVLLIGEEKPYGSAFRKALEVGGHVIEVTYKVQDRIQMVSNAWISK